METLRLPLGRRVAVLVVAVASSGCVHQGWPTLKPGSEWTAVLSDDSRRPARVVQGQGEPHLEDARDGAYLHPATVRVLEQPFYGGAVAGLGILGVFVGAAAGGWAASASVHASPGAFDLSGLMGAGVGAVVGLLLGCTVGALVGLPVSYFIPEGTPPPTEW